DRDIAAMAVHDIPPSLGHFEESAPLLLTWIQARFIGNVVAIIDDDWYLRELHEIGLRHRDGAQRSSSERHRRRDVALRKRKVEARLKGDDSADISVLNGRAPAWAAALRGGD